MAADKAFRRARRLQGIEMSLIVQIAEAAREKRAQGADIISLGTGEPDFPTPEHVKDAARHAMRDDDTKYPPTGGTPALKQAIAGKFARENSLDFAADEIIVSTGAKQVLFNAFMATLDPGDEVIVTAPYWTSYTDIVRVCEAVPKVVECGEADGFLLTPERLRAAIGPRTRWLLLNSPSNPAGAAYSTEALRALMRVVAETPNLWVMSDDIYEHILYDGAVFATPARVMPEVADRCLTINGVSKAYSMTGWRIGYGAGPAPLVKAMQAVQGQATSGACSISQAAAVAALNGPQDLVAERCAVFQQRRDLVVEALNVCPGLICRKPEGAFYVLPSCTGLFGRRTPDGETIGDDMSFARFLLETVGVAIVPGSAFGAPGHFRLSYAYATQELEDACRRIQSACQALA